MAQRVPIAAHARRTWEEVRNEGPASRPRDLPAPIVHRGVRVNVPLAPHARHTWQDARNEGPASRPPYFPAPIVHRGVRVNALVVHPSTGERDVLSGVIHRESYRRNTNQQQAAAAAASSTETNVNVAENAASPTNRALTGRSARDRSTTSKPASKPKPQRGKNEILVAE